MHRASQFSREEFKEWNERMAKEYDPDTYHTSSNGIIAWVERTRVRKILQALSIQPEHSVLEVGVGAGNILAMITAEKRAGIDLSAFLLAKARQRLGPDDVLIEGDAEDLLQHFAPQEFDRVFCSEVLEHVQHPDKVFEQMAAVVKPDGIVVVSVPNESTINRIKRILKMFGVFRLLFPKMADHMEDEWHVHVFGRKLLEQFASKDFHIEYIAAAPYPFLPIRLIAKLTKKV